MVLKFGSRPQLTKEFQPQPNSGTPPAINLLEDNLLLIC
jgi:hypothetical protein